MAHLNVVVQPGARQSRLVGLHGGLPKIQLKARPIDGEANAALIEFIAELCGISKSCVAIASGHTSRFKRLTLPDTAAAHVNALLTR
jgi:uncharacterized protein YggU (UPF0235/DUF167 family)